MTADEELNSFFSLSVDLMVVFSDSGIITRVNPAFTRVLGWSERELIDQNQKKFVHPDDLLSTLNKLKTPLLSENAYVFENRWQCANGTYRWLGWTARRSYKGKLYAVARDITEQKMLEAKERKRYERLVRIDPLTDLLNRRGLEDALSRYDKNVHVVLIDLDDFKKINDQCGHAMGDFALKDVAYMIKNAIRPTDLASRIGGDEFMVVLEDLNWDDAVKVAERIRRNISIVRVHRLDGCLTHTTASMGVLTVEAKSLSNTTNALQQVESQLKKAKTSGKNRVCFSPLQSQLDV